MATTIPVTSNQVPADEELMYELSRGRQEALEALHHRYAPRVFGLAAQTLDRATAEEIVQEIFLAVWRNAGTFDPARGRFRPWVFQIAHHRVLNEHRRRRRQPQLVEDPESLGMADLPDPAPDPGEIVGRGEERATMRAAVEALPPAQRRAVDLAFFEDLTHEQVATELHLPLGTAKTRIRAGLRQLRANLVGARGGGAGVCSGGLLARRTGCAGARHTRARPVHVTRECADPARSHARRAVGGARRSSRHGSSGPVVCEVRAPWGSDRSFQARFTNL
jgi:RNA polymerase sigma-70 factor, ECF subfamily